MSEYGLIQLKEYNGRLLLKIRLLEIKEVSFIVQLTTMIIIIKPWVHIYTVIYVNLVKRQ